MRMRPLLLAVALVGCHELEDRDLHPPAPSATAPKGAAMEAVTMKSEPLKSAPVPKPEALVLEKTENVEHAWTVGPTDGTIASRIAPPSGYARVPVQPRGFGAFLRTLPLAPLGTPVVSYKGSRILMGDHANLAAVVAIDIGTADLQQCADSVIRMHAEWQWSKGRRDQQYSTAGSGPFSFAKYLEGERKVWEASKLVTKTVAPIQPTHTAFRAWLDEVYGSANTASLEKEAIPVLTLGELAPGDFMVMSGNPFGHAVLILDIAVAKDGKRALLLGQGYMPAQSFHVLRPSATETWFALDEAAGSIKTPFWKPFPFSSLRRLPQ